MFHTISIFTLMESLKDCYWLLLIIYKPLTAQFHIKTDYVSDTDLWQFSFVFLNFIQKDALVLNYQKLFG